MASFSLEEPAKHSDHRDRAGGFLLPDASLARFTELPLPSSGPQCATRPPQSLCSTLACFQFVFKRRSLISGAFRLQKTLGEEIGLGCLLDKMALIVRPS